jgi:hypothetical protein
MLAEHLKNTKGPESSPSLLTTRMRILSGDINTRLPGIQNVPKERDFPPLIVLAIN